MTPAYSFVAKGFAMQPIALAQWAHDIRNTLWTAELCLESLQRSSEPATINLAGRSNVLLRKAVVMCSDLMHEAASIGSHVQRQEFDVTQTIAEVFDLIAPFVPKCTTLGVSARGPVYVMADPRDVFRILFNLIHNAVAVARAADVMRRIEFSFEHRSTTICIRIADDGPGLPEEAKLRLFRRGQSTLHGYGLSIARELAERNGAVLELSDCARGTEFTIELHGIERNLAHDQVAAREAWAMSQ
jgi:signal transduction histidine kinase